MATSPCRVTAILAARKLRCSDACPGFLPGDHGIERCDECAALNGYAGQLSDDDIRRTPAARKLTRALVANHTYSVTYSRRK